MIGAGMADLATLIAERDELKSAMRSGALSVRHGDKSVTYRSMSEMRAALDDLNDEIAELEGRKKRRITYVRQSRGF